MIRTADGPERRTRIGPFDVIARIGSGGMGEVYKARDSRLQRDVAIKVLSAAFSSDPDRLARFKREAGVARWTALSP